MTKVFVTGMGVISAIGNNKSENLQSLRNGLTGIGPARYFSSKYANSHVFGEVKKNNEDLKSEMGLNHISGLTRTDLLAFTAIQEALDDAKLSDSEISDFSTSFISASTVGGMCLTDQLYEDANLKSDGSQFLSSYSCGSHLLKIVEKYQIKGFTDVINTACSSSANAIMLGARLIQSGKAKRVIVGGTDSLAKFTVNGFKALQILSDQACKPFDENRMGLTLGEGAAYLVLESEEVSKDKSKYAEILGYGNANDAFHPSSISDEAVGIVAAISRALKSANIQGEKINYINAHGTATQNNDISELKGIIKTLNFIPPYNSTKSYTGHTLGAAGAVEAIFSVFSIMHHELYPSLNCDKPIAPYNKMPIKKYQENISINCVLSNSFGFAGNCTSLIIGKT